MEVEGRAVVFEDSKIWRTASTTDALDVQADDILVLQNTGPRAPGMPEAGLPADPEEARARRVKDMVRISDGG